MNRAMRRAAAKAKPIAAPKRQHVPRAIDEWEQFDEIDRLMHMLENGEVLSQQGHVVMRSGKGELYRVVPAMMGWMEFWRSLAAKHDIPYDDEPMRKLAMRLENGMLLSPTLILEAKRVVEAQRALFRAIPRSAVSSQANTVQIKLMLEDR